MPKNEVNEFNDSKVNAEKGGSKSSLLGVFSFSDLLTKQRFKFLNPFSYAIFMILCSKKKEFLQKIQFQFLWILNRIRRILR